MTDLTRLLELAQDAVDRCLPIVPSGPLVALADAASDFIEAEHETDELEALAVALDEVTTEWSFWPPDAYGSTMAQGPYAPALTRLQEAIEAVLALEDDA